jgi:hypothetical protein
VVFVCSFVRAGGAEQEAIAARHPLQPKTPQVSGEALPAESVVCTCFALACARVCGFIASFARLLGRNINNADSNWGGGAFDYISYAAPEGAVVPYTATYTLLDGDTWGPGIFNRPFSYELDGTISFVPEPSTFALTVLALILVGKTTKRKPSVSRVAGLYPIKR